MFVIPSTLADLIGLIVLVEKIFISLAYDHTTLKAPELVRSPKLSNVGPG